MAARTGRPSRKQKVGCLAAVVLGAGVLWGLSEVSQRLQPAAGACERYAEVVVRQLANCHSGMTKNRSHHIEICKAKVAPSSECLARIEALDCQALETDLVRAAGPACQKSPDR
jgi:hypothetical protein